jgi:hypothetical protein
MAPLIHDDDMFVSNNDDHHHFHYQRNKALHCGQSQQEPDPTNSSAKRRRRVTFANDDSIISEYEVLPRLEYTVQETRSTWYDRYELRSFKDAARSEGKLVERGILYESIDVTIRGLESKTADGTRRKRTNRMNAYSAVFLEIETQQDLGFVDDDAIADVYYNCSEQCQFSAQMVGLRDAEDAKKCYSCAVEAKFENNDDHFGANMLTMISSMAA